MSASNLEKQITQDLTAAMKGKKETEVAVLRLLKSALKYREVEKKAPLTEEEALEVLRKQLKQRRESIEAYQAAGRREAALKEQEEARIIETYLPKEMSDEELQAPIEEAVRETGAAGPRDIGKVMGYLSARLKGKVDFSRLSALVKRRLT